MFYQKYRPNKFSQVFGNDQIVKSLQTSIQKQNLGHAFLFFGPRGVGKTTMARLLAKALICENYSAEKGACLTCQGCKDVLNGTYPDLIEIDAASNNSVDNIRYINEKIHLAPSRGKLKFYIIDEVHMLSKGAFNALLKTLEEPPKNTYFVLATTEIDKVIDTIKSRCQQYEFKRATASDVTKKLEYITKQEGADLNSNDLRKIAVASKGGFRDAETMLESVIVGGNSIDEVLNTVGTDFIVRFFDSIIANNSSLAIELINQVYANGKNIESFNKEVLEYIRNIMLIKEGLSNLVDYDEDSLKLAKDQSGGFGTGFLLKSLKAFNTSLDNSKHAYIPTLPLEIAVLEIIDKSSANISNAKNNPENKGPKNEVIENSNNKVEQSDNIDSESSTSNSKNKSSSTNAQAKITKPKKVQSTKKINKDTKNDKSKEEGEEDVVSATNNKIDSTKFSWGDYVKVVHSARPSVATILKNCKLVGIEENNILIEARFLFHKERLEIPSTFTILVESAKQILGSNCGVVCQVKQKTKEQLTDKNVSYVTVNENEIPKFESKKDKKDKNGEYQIPLDDESFVASPVTVQEQADEQGVDPHNAFAGDFEV